MPSDKIHPLTALFIGGVVLAAITIRTAFTHGPLAAALMLFSLFLLAIIIFGTYEFVTMPAEMRAEVEAAAAEEILEHERRPFRYP